MPVKAYRPTTAGRRFATVDSFSDITKTEPEKKLIRFRKQKAGRSGGKIAVRHRGGGARRFIRLVDSRRDLFDVPARVVAIEYDPNRNARLVLLEYQGGERRYSIAPDGVKVGEILVSSKTAGEIKVGNRFPLEAIPIGLEVHDVEFNPGRGGQIARSAGAALALMAVEGRFAQLKMPSGEIRMVPKECQATIGRVSNPDAWLVRLGKAGRTRHLGIRPTVRGKAMNPVDHPHGGGEGKHPIGLKYPKTPWGRHALGVKTRDPNKASDKLILKRRK